MYLFVLCLIISNIRIALTADIITFSAIVLNVPLITNDSITLIAVLSNCSSSCSCYVQTNKTGNFIPVNFPPNTTKGSVTVKNLSPYKLYSFDINCSEVMYIKTYAIRTDVFRPSPPVNPQIIRIDNHLQVQWTPPIFPRGPIDEYRLIIDGIEIKPPMKNTQLSYKMNEDYIPGVTVTINLLACNIDSQNRTLCSNPKDAQIAFSSKPTIDSSNTPPTLSAYFHRISFRFILIIQMIVII